MSNSFASHVGMALAAAPMGLAFGMAMQNGLVTLPIVIREQFLFKRLIMLKMFLSASAAGAVVLGVAALLFPKKLQDARKAFLGCGGGKTVGSMAMGAATLGCGMAIAGACPGMVIVQLGTGVPHAYTTFLGGLVGAATYAVIQPRFHPMLCGDARPASKAAGAQVAEELSAFKGLKYWQLAFGLAAFLTLPIMAAEYINPWTTELPPFAQPWTNAWPPILSGIIIGSLQFPAVILLGDTLGSSSAYMSVLAQTPFSGAIASHLNGYRKGTDNLWQVVYLASAFVGAYIAANRMGTYGEAAGVPHAAAFIGGFLMLFGSRTASGCTSGHGLSGMALLALGSIAAVPAMFAGGIATGVAFYNVAPDAYLLKV